MVQPSSEVAGDETAVVGAVAAVGEEEEDDEEDDEEVEEVLAPPIVDRSSRAWGPAPAATPPAHAGQGAALGPSLVRAFLMSSTIRRRKYRMSSCVKLMGRPLLK